MASGHDQPRPGPNEGERGGLGLCGVQGFRALGPRPKTLYPVLVFVEPKHPYTDFMG